MIKGYLIIMNGDCERNLNGIYSVFVPTRNKEKALEYVKGNGDIISIEPPMFVELEVTETEPGVKGDTATNVTKPATVETDAQVAVPIFVNQGDVIQIDTRTGEYWKRL